MDVADQRRVKQRLGFRPELIAGFAVPLGIGDQASNQLEDVLLRMDVGEGVVVHTLTEIDRVENLQLVALFQQQPAAFHDDAALRNSFVKIENGSITDNFHFRNWRLLHRHASGVSPYLPACPCSPC